MKEGGGMLALAAFLAVSLGRPMRLFPKSDDDT